MSTALNFFKYLLTFVGPKLSRESMLKLQAVLNYLWIGRWMCDHGFEVSRRLPSAQDVWAVVVNQVRDKRVLYMEFGVANGNSMRYWSRNLRNPEAMLHGFDSFEGMPEDGGAWQKGQFSTKGRVPEIQDPRVRFFKGWFDQVLTTYQLPEHDVLVVNMDADLYSSTIVVLRYLDRHIRPGSFIYFDEINHVDHEARAYDEWMSETGLQFRLVASDVTMAHCFFECIGLSASYFASDPSVSARFAGGSSSLRAGQAVRPHHATSGTGSPSGPVASAAAAGCPAAEALLRA